MAYLIFVESIFTWFGLRIKGFESQRYQVIYKVILSGKNQQKSNIIH